MIESFPSREGDPDRGMIESFPSREGDSDSNNRQSRRLSSHSQQRFLISNPFWKGPKANSDTALGYHSDCGGYYGAAGRLRSNNDITMNDKYSSDAEKSQSQRGKLSFLRREVAPETTTTENNNNNNKSNNLLVCKVEPMSQGQTPSIEEALMNEMENMKTNYEAKLHNLRLELHKRTNSITTLENALMMQSKTINDLRDRAEYRKRLDSDTNLKKKDRRRRRVSTNGISDVENSHGSIDCSLDDNSSSRLQSLKCNRSSSAESSRKKAQQQQLSTPFGSQQRKNAKGNRKCPSNLTKESQQYLSRKFPEIAPTVRRNNISSSNSKKFRLQRSQSVPGRRMEGDLSAIKLRIQERNNRSEPRILPNHKLLNNDDHHSPPPSLNSDNNTANRHGDSVVSVTTTTCERRSPTQSTGSSSKGNNTNDNISLPPHPRALNDGKEDEDKQQISILQREAVETDSVASQSTALTTTIKNTERISRLSMTKLRQSFPHDYATTDDDDKQYSNNHRRRSTISDIASRTTFNKFQRSSNRRRNSLHSTIQSTSKHGQSISRIKFASTSSSLHNSTKLLDNEMGKNEFGDKNNGRYHPQRTNLNISYKRNRQRILQQQQKEKDHKQEQEGSKHSQQQQPIERQSFDKKAYIEDSNKEILRSSPMTTIGASLVQLSSSLPSSTTSHLHLARQKRDPLSRAELQSTLMV